MPVSKRADSTGAASPGAKSATSTGPTTTSGAAATAKSSINEWDQTFAKVRSSRPSLETRRIRRPLQQRPPPQRPPRLRQRLRRRSRLARLQQMPNPRPWRRSPRPNPRPWRRSPRPTDYFPPNSTNFPILSLFFLLSQLFISLSYLVTQLYSCLNNYARLRLLSRSRARAFSHSRCVVIFMISFPRFVDGANS